MKHNVLSKLQHSNRKMIEGIEADVRELKHKGDEVSKQCEYDYLALLLADVLETLTSRERSFFETAKELTVKEMAIRLALENIIWHEVEL